MTLRLRVPHMTVVSAQLVSLKYAYWLSVGWGVVVLVLAYVFVIY